MKTEKFELFTLHPSVKDSFSAEKLAIASFSSKRNNGSRGHSRNQKAATSLFDGVVSETVDADTFNLNSIVNGTKKATMRRGGDANGCDWVFIKETNDLRYALIEGREDKNIFFENPTLVITKLDDDRWMLDATQTQINGFNALEAPKNERVQEIGFTMVLTNIDEGDDKFINFLGQEKSTRRKTLASDGSDFTGATRDTGRVIISTNPNCPIMTDLDGESQFNEYMCDFVISEEDLNDRDIENLILVVRTARKEYLTPFVIPLQELITEIF